MASGDNQDNIKIKDLLKVDRNGTVQLNHVSFGVEKKQVMGIVGPRRSGKRALLDIIATLESKTSGSIKLFNLEFAEDQALQMDSIGYFTEHVVLWQNLNVPQHLSVYGRMKGLSGAALQENLKFYLEGLQLKKLKSKKIHALTYWEKKKVCLAIALIGSPDVLLLPAIDETLDLSARIFLLNWLNHSKNLSDTSALCTFENFEEAESAVDKIGLLFSGHLASIGKKEHILSKYAEEGYRLKFKPQGNEQSGIIITPFSRHSQALRRPRATTILTSATMYQSFF